MGQRRVGGWEAGGVSGRGEVGEGGGWVAGGGLNLPKRQKAVLCLQ